MPQIDLVVGSGGESLSVRNFAVHEGMSTLFEVSIEAVSSNDDIDFESVVGHEASLRVATGMAHAQRDARKWLGICSHMKQTRAESAGLSTYQVTIVPRLWLLTQRRNYRLFQHLSVPEIVAELLSDWRIEAEWRIHHADYPKLEVRTQYGESDYSFICRLLEEAGISFFFHDDADKAGVLVLHDRPNAGNHRGGAPVRYVDNPSDAAEKEYVTEVVLSQEVKPGHFLLRDFDFRNPKHQLLAASSKAHGVEGMLEQYSYEPGAFVVEGGKHAGTPVADDKGVARAEDRAGKHLAELSFEAVRASKRVVEFRTNVIDLHPGALFSMEGHARSDLAPDKKLLVTDFSANGSPSGEWTMSGRAVFTDVAYHPLRVTPKPHVNSVQSAVVVGPQGEEIHTDEFGRVRVHFHWDQHSKHNDHSSCWIRVSQGWAGSGFGMMAIPRVGQEVLVGFLEGDPNQPVVVGRLYNNTSRVPYKLPEHKTVSGWRTDSTPKSDGFNEFRFDDTKGHELVHVHAQKNLSKRVKHDEHEITEHDRVIHVGRKLTLTTGEASIILEGPTLRIEARSVVHMKSKKGDVIIEGGPKVKINPPDVIAKAEAKDDVINEPKLKSEKSKKQLAFGTERYAKGVKIHGTLEFRQETVKAMKKLEVLPTGRGLLAKIARSGKTVTVIETRASAGYSKADDIELATKRANGRPSKGSSSTIGFNPRYSSAGASSEAVLGHCLTQACQNALGLRNGETTKGVKNSALQAIGIAPFSMRSPTENALRRSMKLPLRESY